MSSFEDPEPASRTAHRVLVLSEVRGDTRRYRALHLVEELRLLGVPCRFVHMADPQAWQIANQPWTVAVFHRVGYGREAGRICRRLADNGALVLADFDDLIFDLSAFPYINSPDFSDPVRVALYKENMMNIQRMLDLTEASLASTDFLAERINRVGKQAWVHRNAFSLEMLAGSEAARKGKRAKTNERVVIGYASGTPTHNWDFELIKPALMEILRRFPQVELKLIGPLDAGSDWGGLAERISHQGLVPWRALPDLLAGLDINLAPLRVDNPFSQSKSEIKYMEAAMVETPTVASPSEAFRFAIRQGETGYLAESTDQWVENLSALVQDSDLRAEIGARAYTEVVNAYHPACRAEQLANTLEEISLQVREKPFWDSSRPIREAIVLRSNHYSSPQYWLPASNEQLPSFQLGLYLLRNRGLFTLIKNMWIYFRRWISPVIPF